MNKFFEYFYEFFLSLTIGSIVMAFILLVFSVAYRVVKDPTAALFIMAFITCTTGLGYIIRKFANKKREEHVR